MSNTRFAKRDIVIGHNVQFGHYCSIASDVHFGNNILLAGRVCFVGKNDHKYDIPGQYIWDGERGKDGITIVEDDVWIGHNTTIIAGVTIGKGSIIAAGSLLNKDVPPCEIWGGLPARKIKDRFKTNVERTTHILFLDSL
jgi:acetyltransferase-like isoleucine patch superfamily enzyme